MIVNSTSYNQYSVKNKKPDFGHRYSQVAQFIMEKAIHSPQTKANKDISALLDLCETKLAGLPLTVDILEGKEKDIIRLRTDDGNRVLLQKCWKLRDEEGLRKAVKAFLKSIIKSEQEIKNELIQIADNAEIRANL